VNWAQRFQARGSALCVGLDPVQERLPPACTAIDFCLEVIDATAEFAACYKPNLAFFECLGPDALAGLARTILPAIRARGIPVLLDGKRGDIASTAEAYAGAYFGGPFDADALTVNASVGLDAIEPFRKAARERDRGVFLLLRTSNPGAALFQEPAEATMIDAIRAEPAYGAVIGATDPAVGARLRAALPDTLFLVPGFGEQGGDDLRAFFNANGTGAVVNSSRGILYPEAGANWKDAVREAARAPHATIERARSG